MTFGMFTSQVAAMILFTCLSLLRKQLDWLSKIYLVVIGQKRDRTSKVILIKHYLVFINIVKERDSGGISLCKQSRSHYQGLSKRGTLIGRYLLMQRMVY